MLKVFPENERVFRILRSFQSKFEIIITFFLMKERCERLLYTQS